MTNVLIIGVGEIGKSIIGVYERTLDDEINLYFKDPNVRIITRNDTIKNVDNLNYNIGAEYMHVCIPFTKNSNFVNTVTDYINEYNPLYTIIHSTIDIGTTRKIFDKTNVNIAHSPVMGIHPNLTESILTFKKIIGSPTEYAAEQIAKHYTNIGIESIIYNSPEESEAAKLLSTGYYGWNILFMHNAHKLCKDNDLNFDNVYAKTNTLYNKGYDTLDMKHVKRPVLKYIPGKIGGHCIIPNFKILEDVFTPAKIGLKLNDELEDE